MSDPPFLSMARAEPGDADYLFQTCIEALAPLPSVMEEADKLETQCGWVPDEIYRRQQVVAKLLERTSILYENLGDWFKDMQQKVTPPTPLTPVPEFETGQTPFPPVWLSYTTFVDGFLWTLYWVMSLYLNQVIKQLQARYTLLLAGKDAKIFQLPSNLANLGDDQATLDEYADNICGSACSDLDKGTFAAQENMVGIFSVQRYYEQRGDCEKLRWCLQILKMMEADGLNLGVQENEVPGHGLFIVAKCLADQPRSLTR
jgi:hypothetical protein